MPVEEDNPLQTAGFEFVEYATPDPRGFGEHLEQIGFAAVARHRSKDVWRYRQGGINLIVNADVPTFERSYSHLRGVRICAVALRVRDAASAYGRALRAGAWEVESPVGVMEVNIPAIAGAGDTLIYFVDRFEQPSIYDIDFLPLESDAVHLMAASIGLTPIHSVTYRVNSGRTRDRAAFCATVLGFREYADASEEGESAVTMMSPAGDIRFAYVESSRAGDGPLSGSDLKHPEFAQHATFATANMSATVAALESRGILLERQLPGSVFSSGGATSDHANGVASRMRMFVPRHADSVFFELVEVPNG